MNYLDFEKLGYYDLKGALNDYIHNRIKEIESNKSTSEYDFCTVSGQLEELENLFKFINFTNSTNTPSKSDILKEIQDVNKSNT
jgi:hypothetical protein